MSDPQNMSQRERDYWDEKADQAGLILTPMSDTPKTGCTLPVLRDQHGQQIRENDILRVFHFHGRKRGKGYEKHYMYKIARVVDWPRHNDIPIRTWAFFHTAEPPDGTLSNCYSPFKGGWHTDQTLEGVEVLDSPETLKIENEKRRIS